jgi:hypothetical protein
MILSFLYWKLHWARRSSDWVYQQERFPLLTHGLLIAAFSLAATGFSARTRGHLGLPAASSLLVAFLSSLLFFFLLRVADEFKDFDDDSRHRPYRPVQRGVISLRELARAGVVAALLQVGLALWFVPELLPLLLVTWAYLALMSKEFFVPEWLKARPVIYLLSHMLIMPLIALYAAACDWLAAGQDAPEALGWLLAVSFATGLTLEIGRKVHAPQDEEPGVETYSQLWGHRRAAAVWLAALTFSGLLALRAVAAIGGARALSLIFASALAGAVLVMRR